MHAPAQILALSGGIGGAKLALGLYRELPHAALSVLCNTGDDFEHLGLHVSPDIDTVLYTLAGLANRELGWGRRDETWTFMNALQAIGGETWFRLGDGDLALHVERTRRIAGGESLSAIVDDFRRQLPDRPPRNLGSRSSSTFSTRAGCRRRGRGAASRGSDPSPSGGSTRWSRRARRSRPGRPGDS